MKLVHSQMEKQFVFHENIIELLIIENPSLFTEFIRELFQQSMGEEGRFVLSENDKILSCKDKVEVILNPLNLDINDKRILNRLYGKIKELSVDEDFYTMTMERLFNTQQYVEHLLEQLDFDVRCQEVVDIVPLLKVFNVQLVENDAHLLEKILDYLLVSFELLGKEVFVFVNIKSYLSTAEIKDFYRFVFYQKLKILLIENRQYESIETENVCVVDQDLCEIFK
ncbi:MAG: CRISPR-associated Csn2 [Firmicutes bacterium]|nr:CRISPR-associated Csn2 [Bacillota bacterium]